MVADAVAIVNAFTPLELARGISGGDALPMAARLILDDDGVMLSSPLFIDAKVCAVEITRTRNDSRLTIGILGRDGTSPWRPACVLPSIPTCMVGAIIDDLLLAPGQMGGAA